MKGEHMKIEIRCLNEIDPYELAYHANNIHISQYLRNSFPYPYTIEHAMKYISHALDKQTYDFGIVYNGECIGCVSTLFHNDIYIKNCELGYWIGEKYWNKGIISIVIKMMCQYIFSNFSVHKIYAEVLRENKASARALEKNGFQLEACLKEHAFKNGKYYDILIYTLKEDDYGS